MVEIREAKREDCFAIRTLIQVNKIQHFYVILHFERFAIILLYIVGAS